MNKFRLASRDLFNHFFYVADPYNNRQLAWLQEERFRDIQAVLFQKQVVEPMFLNTVEEYGRPQPNILVEPNNNHAIPIMLNREINTGYWDYPLKEVDANARLFFVCFFDWDQLNYRDNRYVCIQVNQCLTHSEIVGKHGLIESQYVRFIKG
jgi:hypothetical protein